MKLHLLPKSLLKSFVIPLAAFGLYAPALVSAQTPAKAAMDDKFPKGEIQKIIGAEGDYSDGLLSIDISRDDIGKVKTKQGMIVDGAFEIDGMIYFQKLDDGSAFLNACFPLKEEEVQTFISTLLTQGIVFQAYHQHFSSDPQVWFVHFRGNGDPLVLAREVRAALNTTSVALPQTMPMNPTTTLDKAKLVRILHGTAMVGAQGVVTVEVERTDDITIDGVKVDPGANIANSISFKPKGDGNRADVVVDFSMEADEIQPVLTLMKNYYGWYVGCLYNQETDETPQLYFSHMLKSGNAYDLAGEIRRGLNLTTAE